MRVLLTGATGFIGQKVGQELVRRGHQVVALSRKPEPSQMSFPCELRAWEAGQPLPAEAVKGVDGVIHLAGESIAGRRWNERVKTALRESRVRGTETLIASLPSSVRTLVAASAIGFYGERGEEELTESSARGEGFLADLCWDWEEATAKFSGRSVVFRVGVVLGRGGGALAKMIPPYRDGYGGALGGGRQWMSWIHRDDLVRLLVDALESDGYRGVYNAVAPTPTRNADFSRALAARFGKGLFLPVPKFALSIAVGEMAGSLLASQRVLPARLLEKGFRFQFGDLTAALGEAVSDLKAFEEELVVEQWVPRSVSEIFPFFESETNLEEITPPWLNFKVLGKNTERIEAGTLIDYRLSLHGVPLRWRTRIDEWQANKEFVDTQLKGPYKKWHHRHEFLPLSGGTLLRDTVRYRLPLSGLGTLVAGFKVKRDVAAIFAYRRQVIARRYLTGS